MADSPLQVKLFNRDFTERGYTPAVTYEVFPYSWKAIGGPDKATIACTTNDEHALWQLFTLLRCPLKIVDDKQRAVWWGYVASVTVRVAAIEIGASLDAMGNSVTVAYAALSGGQSSAGSRATTSAATDADSIATYGTKELRVSLNDATQTQAEQLRDLVLAQRKVPLPLARASGADAEGSFSATLDCRGWWETLSWRNFSYAAQSEKYEPDTGTDVANVSIDSGHTRLAQQFQLPGGSDTFTVESIAVAIVNANWDASYNVSIELWSDSGGSPSARLAGGLLARADAQDGASNVLTTVAMDTPVTITGAAPYWIVLKREVDATGSNYFAVRWNIANGYSRGDSKWWNGSAWGAGTGNDVFFHVNGVVQTSTQVGNIVTAVGQFLSTVEIENASGVYTAPYRNGDKTGKAEAEALLSTGVSGARRMLATVTEDRHVRIYQEPLPTEPTYSMQRDGSLYDAQRAPLDKELCPVGVWVALKDVVPPSADFSSLAQPSPFFIEEATYDPRTLQFRPTTRGTPNVFSIAGLKK